MERGTRNRSGSLSGSHPYAGRNTPKNRGVKFYGVSKRKEQYDDV